MNDKRNFEAALFDADLEDIETLEAGAAFYDRLGLEPHRHAWTPLARRSRLVGDVWQYPHECGCGATAWKQNWCGKTMFVDISMPASAEMKQDDAFGTYLPNGSLRWFGFDFDRVRLPYESLLENGDTTCWIGTSTQFIHRMRIHDAAVEITTGKLELDGDDQEFLDVVPRTYLVDVTAHGLENATTECAGWREVQQHCRQLETALADSFDERHEPCHDEAGQSTHDACSLCERG